jgi:hypothetical protein
MAVTDYFESLILGHALLQNPFSIEDWYVGLWTSDPTAAGLLVGEVAAGDYERKPVSWNPLFGNLSRIDWAPAISNWGTVTYLALTNSPNKNSGNVLVYEPTGESFQVNIGQPLTLPPGGLAVVAA